MRERKKEKPSIYQIAIEGHLNDQWSKWFDGFTITLDERGRTYLTDQVNDQTALHGLLSMLQI